MNPRYLDKKLKKLFTKIIYNAYLNRHLIGIDFRLYIDKIWYYSWLRVEGAAPLNEQP